MIKFDITSRSFETDDRMRDYLEGKIGGLEKYLPRRVRDEVQATVVLENDPNGREDNRCVCEVILTVPGAKFMAKEGAINMYAAIDIVDAKLQAQARTYKDKSVTEPRRARMLGRLIGRTSETDPATPATETE